MENDILLFAFQALVLIFSVIIHEISHGYVAERLGDSTARLAGRLTLNPLKHIDLFGSILLPLILFFTGSKILIGWAKPVPYNPAALKKDYRFGPLKVALAGPASNLLVLVVVGGLARLGFGFLDTTLISLLAFIAYLNALLAVFNLIPIPPLDGSKILPLLFPKIGLSLERLGFFGIIIVFVLLFYFFNVIQAMAAKLMILVAGPSVFLALLQFFGG